MSLPLPTADQVLAMHQQIGPMTLSGDIRVGLVIAGDPDTLTAPEPMRFEADIPWRVFDDDTQVGILKTLLVWLTAGTVIPA